MCMLTIHIAWGDPDYSFYPIIIKTSSDNPSAQPQDTPSPDGTLSTVSYAQPRSSYVKQTSCLTPPSPCLTERENWLSKEVCNGGHCQPGALCAPNPEANKGREGVFLKERKKRYPSRDKVLDSPGGSLLLLPVFMLPTTWLIDQSIKWRSQDRRWSWNQVGYSCWKNGVPLYPGRQTSRPQAKPGLLFGGPFTHPDLPVRKQLPDISSKHIFSPYLTSTWHNDRFG